MDDVNYDSMSRTWRECRFSIDEIGESLIPYHKEMSLEEMTAKVIKIEAGLKILLEMKTLGGDKQ
ncbi:MAG: hypothetical protein H8D92_01870 [Pelagibacteraceae bacterium]|nr:hypothetical protein [Pelagibacteraceae bacterium]